jgi:hypothetical protein
MSQHSARLQIATLQVMHPHSVRGSPVDVGIALATASLEGFFAALFFAA